MDYVRQYKTKMYETSNSCNLRTGDVVLLELDDIKKIARHESVLDLFRHFDKTPEYYPKLWAILNKTCDMVHDPANDRHFKSNLFLAPLQMLRTALKKGTLGDLLYSEDIITPEKVLTDTFQKYFSKKAKNKNPNNSGMPPEQYYENLNKAVINPAVNKIKELIEGHESVIMNPAGLLEGLVISTKLNGEIQEELKSFMKSSEWEQEFNKYNMKQKETQEINSKIILKAEKASIKIAELAHNQMDSKGIFFYEPMDRISDPKYDLAYIIQLQDLITLKITKKVQENGDLFNLLIQKRVAMLTSNFSDRLLNIMGNYFSKIGTPDIMSDDILVLYKNVYPGDFYTSINEYKEHNNT